MVEVLWPPSQEDPSVVAIMRAMADELDAIEDLMLTIREQAWPHKADDTEGLLAIHERMLGIPIKPEGVSLPSRQDAARSAIQSRRVGSAKHWVDRFNALMSGNPWSYKRNSPGRGQLTITIPYSEHSYSASQVIKLAERVTPAHIELLVAYESGWLAGISRVGDPL
jgi:hypothetical protein